MRGFIIGLAACATAACAPVRPAPAGPALAGYFDCVRAQGAAISAHRAQSGDDQPENSLAAITATGRAIPGALVEIDAALTRDGRLVLMHDDRLERTSTGVGAVAALSLAEVRRARLRAPDGRLSGEAPPTLVEALAAAGRVGAIAAIDLKPAGEAATLSLARAVIAEVRRVGAQRRVVLITYTPASARAVAALAPEMMISAGLDAVEGLDGLDPRQILAWTGAGTPRPALWAALKARGVEVQFGTLGAAGRRLDDVYAADGEVDEYRSLVEAGVSVIATDAPLAVLDVLRPQIAAAVACPR